MTKHESCLPDSYYDIWIINVAAINVRLKADMRPTPWCCCLRSSRLARTVSDMCEHITCGHLRSPDVCCVCEQSHSKQNRIFLVLSCVKRSRDSHDITGCLLVFKIRRGYVSLVATCDRIPLPPFHVQINTDITCTCKLRMSWFLAPNCA